MDDTIFNVLMFLDVNDIIWCSLVNKNFNRVCKWNLLWKVMMKRKFKDVKLFKDDYYETYKLCHGVKILKTGGQLFQFWDTIDECYNKKAIAYNYFSRQSMPTQIGLLHNLTNLYMQHIHIKDKILPTEIGNMSSLIVFHFIGCGIKIIPTEIGKLNNLINFECHNNNIKVLPSELGNMNKLTSFNAHHNKIEMIPVQLEQLKYLSTLVLYNNNIVTIPIEICKMQSLKTLDLSSNKIAIMPSDIRHLENLTSLKLGNNVIKIMPNEIGQLCNLELCDLSENFIKRIPLTMLKLKKLHTLKIKNQKFTIDPKFDDASFNII